MLWDTNARINGLVTVDLERCCPGVVRVAMAGGRVGGRVAAASAAVCHPLAYQVAYLFVHFGNLPIHISANYTRRPGAKQQACAAKEEQVA